MGQTTKALKNALSKKLSELSFLIERSVTFVLELIFEDEKVKKAIVEIDKPHTLRFSGSVSTELSGESG